MPVMSQTALAAMEMITISQGIEIPSIKQSINILFGKRPLELKKEGEGKICMITHWFENQIPESRISLPRYRMTLELEHIVQEVTKAQRWHLRCVEHRQCDVQEVWTQKQNRDRGKKKHTQLQNTGMHPKLRKGDVFIKEHVCNWPLPSV